MPPRLILLCTGAFLFCSMLPAPAQMDDFTDGNDDGWTRFDPIGTLVNSPYALHQVQSGQYRLSCDPSPDPSAVGPARVGSYRADTTLTNFTVVVDVVSWNAALDQSFGLLARLQSNPGPGTLAGYALNYQPGDQDIEINRLVNEAPVNLARVASNLAPGEAYRFVFTGQGTQLQAAVYNIADPLRPLVTVAAEDAAFTAGHCGVFGYDTSNTGAVNVTFDSYTAGPASVPVLSFVASLSDFTVGWPRLTGAWHLEASADLAVWSDVTAGGAAAGAGISHTEMLAGRKFFRMAPGWRSP